MNGYSNDEIFTPDERRAFLAAEELVKRLPDYDAKGDRLRCHEVVRLVSWAMTPIIHGEWDVVDGHFATVEHSWLVSRTRAKSLAGYERGTILDCYTVARLPMVQLLSRSVHFHDVLVGAFRPGGPRGDIRADVMTSARDRIGGIAR